jgi:hypothetical protein
MRKELRKHGENIEKKHYIKQIPISKSNDANALTSLLRSSPIPSNLTDLICSASWKRMLERSPPRRLQLPAVGENKSTNDINFTFDFIGFG